MSATFAAAIPRLLLQALRLHSLGELASAADGARAHAVFLPEFFGGRVVGAILSPTYRVLIDSWVSRLLHPIIPAPDNQGLGPLAFGTRKGSALEHGGLWKGYF